MTKIYTIGGSYIKKIPSLIIIILLVSSFSNISFAKSSYNIIYVDDDGGADYTRIQDAIDNARVGDTIFVHEGIYFENVIIHKLLNLIGSNMNSTIIDGNKTGELVGAYTDVFVTP